MTYIVMTYIVMANIVMAYSYLWIGYCAALGATCYNGGAEM